MIHVTRRTLSIRLDGTEVGFFDGGRRTVTIYDDAADACADFVYRETLWVKERRAD